MFRGVVPRPPTLRFPLHTYEIQGTILRKVLMCWCSKPQRCNQPVTTHHSFKTMWWTLHSIHCMIMKASHAEAKKSIGSFPQGAITCQKNHLVIPRMERIKKKCSMWRIAISSLFTGNRNGTSLVWMRTEEKDSNLDISVSQAFAKIIWWHIRALGKESTMGLALRTKSRINHKDMRQTGWG